MLLSLSRRFIFVANLKSASSAIEIALSEYAEIRLTQTHFGKHDTLSAISRKFHWTKKHVPPEQFFIFGVLRQPVDFVLSLYNSHTLEAFNNQAQSSRGISFDDFWNGWCSTSWQAAPQCARFKDEHGHLRMTHLVDYDHLEAEFPRICRRIGVEATLCRANASPKMLRRRDLSPEQIAAIMERYSGDYELLKNRPHALGNAAPEIGEVPRAY